MLLTDIGKVVEQEWLKTKEIRLNVDLDYNANPFSRNNYYQGCRDVSAGRLKNKGDGSTTRLYES
jgi:hypothetical protein